MKTVTLGNTGIEVSRLCLGTMYFGTQIDQAGSVMILNEYARAGGRFLDTANKYASWVPGFAGGESEYLLGEWLQRQPERDNFFVATKVGLPMPGVEQGLRAEQIVTECEKSLRRLRRDTIDLYYAHADDRETPLEETLKAFDTLVRSGKVRFVGASNYSAERLQMALALSRQHRLTSYCCVQMKHAYLQPRPGVPQEFPVQMAATPELNELCTRAGLILLAYSPLLGGLFGRDDKAWPSAYDNEENRQRVQVVRTVARELGATPNQVALAWLLRQAIPPVIPVMGISSVEQLRDNLGALELRLTLDRF